QEKKEWPPHLSVQPTLSGLKRLGAVSLNARDHSLAIDALATHRLDIVVEEIEPFGNARFAPQDECRHRRPRRVSVFLERLLKSGDRISEAESDVVANAMVSGQHAGENRDMRRKREGGMAAALQRGVYFNAAIYCFASFASGESGASAMT